MYHTCAAPPCASTGLHIYIIIANTTVCSRQFLSRLEHSRASGEAAALNIQRPATPTTQALMSCELITTPNPTKLTTPDLTSCTLCAACARACVCVCLQDNRKCSLRTREGFRKVCVNKCYERFNTTQIL